MGNTSKQKKKSKSSGVRKFRIRMEPKMTLRPKTNSKGKPRRKGF